MTIRTTKRLLRRTSRTGARIVRAGAVAGLKEVLPAPPALVDLPEGRVIELPGRGSTFVVDVPGPTTDAPTLVLLHGLSCTAYLGWAHAMDELRRTFRVVTFDQRWHGRGIRSSRFRISDCADDVAAVMDALGVERALVAGYSMGGAVAQQTWRQHPERVSGLLLCSTASTWRGHLGEKLFFPVMSAAMHPLSAFTLARVELHAGLLPESPGLDLSDPTRWAKQEFRSTSLWSLPEVLTEMGRFNALRWLPEVNVPTAVVVTERDRTIPTGRQLQMAERIPGAEVFRAPGGHASVFLDATRWLPVFLEAVERTARRAYGPSMRDRSLGLRTGS